MAFSSKDIADLVNGTLESYGPQYHHIATQLKTYEVFSRWWFNNIDAVDKAIRAENKRRRALGLKRRGKRI